MKKTFQFLMLFAVMLLSSKLTYAQQNPTSINSQKMLAFYKSLLNIDSVKAGQVMQIIATYKSGLKQAVADQALSDDVKGKKIKGLMVEKNKLLEAILTLEQQAKIIPTAEREVSKPVSQ